MLVAGDSDPTNSATLQAMLWVLRSSPLGGELEEGLGCSALSSFPIKKSPGYGCLRILSLDFLFQSLRDCDILSERKLLLPCDSYLSVVIIIDGLVERLGVVGVADVAFGIAITATSLRCLIRSAAVPLPS